MTLNEFTTIIRYLRSQDIEIVELGRQLGELCNLTLTPCGHATWIRTVSGYELISYLQTPQQLIENLYAIAVW